MTTTHSKVPAAPQIDLIWGAENIAKEIGITTRQCFHMLSKRSIPARKVGGHWVIERGRLHSFFTEEAA